MVVYVLCHLAIDRVTSDGEVNSELQAGQFFFQRCDLNLRILKLLQQLKVDFLRFVDLLFHFENMIVDLLQLALHLHLSLHGFFQVGSQGRVFLTQSLVVSFVGDSDAFILSNDVLLLESSFLIVRDDFLVLRL